MFQERIRELIDRHCLLLRDGTGQLGRMLAHCDPYEGPVKQESLRAASEACSALREKGETISLPEVERSAMQLDSALRELEERERIEPWDMVKVMALQGQLASAVDEIEADQSRLFVDCTTEEALAVAPMPDHDRSAD